MDVELSSNNKRNIVVINMNMFVNVIIFGIVIGLLGTSNATQNSSNQSATSDIDENKMSTTTEEAVLPLNLIGGEGVDLIFLKGEILNKYSDNEKAKAVDDKPMALKSLQKIWHVGIYDKQMTPYMQICGGTLVTTKAVISAAHCFWSETKGALPARCYAVGTGKRYRPWNDPQDFHNQKSDVAAIHIPVRYRDSATSYQEDIAVLILAQEFRTTYAVKPACIDFDEDLDNEQLKEGNMGTILGWGLTEEDGDPSPVLNYLELPAVPIEKCLNRADAGFLRYITSDKICAGVTTGKAMCRGDSGGGLVFADPADPALVPYLRGVASTAPRNEHRCNAYALAALTHVRAHRDFLRRHIPGLEEECKKHFPSVQDRYQKHEKQPEKQTTGAPLQFICNCFCNNKEPTHDEIIFRD